MSTDHQNAFREQRNAPVPNSLEAFGTGDSRRYIINLSRVSLEGTCPIGCHNQVRFGGT